MNTKKGAKIIAVDFDGTLFARPEVYPDVGEPIHKTIQLIKKYKEKGCIIILWTCREGDHLERALRAAEEYELEFDAINENVICPDGYDSRKIYANLYIDDKAINVEDI